MNHLRREIETQFDRRRIDTALETIAGVGDDPGLAACRCNAQRIEPGALDEDVPGRLGAAGRFAANDAAKAERPAVVGDDTHGLVDRVLLAVQPQEFLARLAEPCADGALQFVGVVDVQAAGRGPG